MGCNSRPPGALKLVKADELPTASALGVFTDVMPFSPSPSTPLAGLGALYQRHYEVVFRAALRVTGNPADAEDVLQTVFLRVLAGRKDLEDSTLTAAYFRRASVNAAVDVLRRRELRAASVYDDQAPSPSSAPQVLLKEQLRRAIATLDSEDATLFLLRHVEGLSNEELAEMFDMEKNNVAVRLHRIRQRLQAEMER